MDVENWLSPQWAWLLLVYPSWRAFEACPWLVFCAAGTALALAVAAAGLLLARDLTIASRLLSGD